MRPRPEDRRRRGPSADHHAEAMLHGRRRVAEPSGVDFAYLRRATQRHKPIPRSSRAYQRAVGRRTLAGDSNWPTSAPRPGAATVSCATLMQKAQSDPKRSYAAASRRVPFAGRRCHRVFRLRYQSDEHATTVHNYDLSRGIAIGHQIDVRLREILRLADTPHWQGSPARGVECLALRCGQVGPQRRAH